MQITTFSATYFGALVVFPLDKDTIRRLATLQLSLAQALAQARLPAGKIQNSINAEYHRLMRDLSEHQIQDYVFFKGLYERICATHQHIEGQGFTAFQHTAAVPPQRPRQSRSGSIFILALLGTLFIGAALPISSSHNKAAQDNSIHPHK